MNLRWVAAACIGLLGCQGKTPEKVELKTQKDKVSYSIGQSVGKNLKDQGLDVIPETVAKGLKDAYTGVKSEMTDEQIKETMDAFQKEMIAKRDAETQKMAADQKKAGDAFLTDNGKKEGVITLPSGLQYKVIKAGAGRIPKATDTVMAHYRGTLVDGTEFDSSYKRGEPTTFPINQVIPGWQEALQKMAVGSKWQVFIPSDLAYGPPGRGPIPPNAVLIFDMELTGIK